MSVTLEQGVFVGRLHIDWCFRQVIKTKSDTVFFCCPDTLQSERVAIPVTSFLNADLLRIEGFRVGHNICYPLPHDCCVSVAELVRDGTTRLDTGGSATLTQADE